MLAGVCRAPEAYPWSSHRQTAGLERGRDWVTTGLVRAAAHPDPRHGAAVFRRIVAARLAEKSPRRDAVLHPDVALQPDVTGLQPRPRMLREGRVTSG